MLGSSDVPPVQAVVMDVGSSWTKMGLAGQEKPTCCFPTVVGRMDLRAYDRVTGQVSESPLDKATDSVQRPPFLVFLEYC